MVLRVSAETSPSVSEASLTSVFRASGFGLVEAAAGGGLEAVEVGEGYVDVVLLAHHGGGHFVGGGGFGGGDAEVEVPEGFSMEAMRRSFQVAWANCSRQRSSMAVRGR